MAVYRVGRNGKWVVCASCAALRPLRRYRRVPLPRKAGGGAGPRTHDYSGANRCLGHDCSFDPIAGGWKGLMHGCGEGLHEGDYLILDSDGGTARYQIERLSYQLQPASVWSALVCFAPRCPSPERTAVPSRDAGERPREGGARLAACRGQGRQAPGIVSLGSINNEAT